MKATQNSLGVKVSFKKGRKRGRTIKADEAVYLAAPKQWPSETITAEIRRYDLGYGH